MLLLYAQSKTMAIVLKSAEHFSWECITVLLLHVHSKNMMVVQRSAERFQLRVYHYAIAVCVVKTMAVV